MCHNSTVFRFQNDETPLEITLYLYYLIYDISLVMTYDEHDTAIRPVNGLKNNNQNLLISDPVLGSKVIF